MMSMVACGTVCCSHDAGYHDALLRVSRLSSGDRLDHMFRGDKRLLSTRLNDGLSAEIKAYPCTRSTSRENSDSSTQAHMRRRLHT